MLPFIRLPNQTPGPAPIVAESLKESRAASLNERYDEMARDLEGSIKDVETMKLLDAGARERVRNSWRHDVEAGERVQKANQYDHEQEIEERQLRAAALASSDSDTVAKANLVWYLAVKIRAARFQNVAAASRIAARERESGRRYPGYTLDNI